ncbi:Kazal-type serine protease inhibitor domain-containing protein 1 [Paragonimus heterotremus]|uniref:Kazal-type serine protease inhibitor domain-containing protein 1 n=1 Tax=Paragonimus heterotremus TaxID=100268 RepID=A0A8J4SNZ2_9TREM|nr:Kazal-type serine protease inhibitor domain-containing protein 1 [Paragonimus heterotremus]
MFSSLAILVISVLGYSQAWYSSVSTGPKTLDFIPPKLEACGPCDLTQCILPTECKAGFVRDRCDCCSVCGLEESHLCNLDKDLQAFRQGRLLLPWHGRCGRNLECRVRNDINVSLVGKQSICYCLEPGVACGSDGQTYTHCQLEAEQVASKGLLQKISDGPCKTKPTIELKAPHSAVKNGDKVTLVCEARGYPKADITWFHTKPAGRGQDLRMPSDSEDVSVSYRGGNHEAHAISYLQITDFKLEHEGEYRCAGENEFGISTESARLVLSF